MKILMTGATGLIGQELGLELVRRGHEVLVVSRSRSKALMNLPFPCEVIEGDLSHDTLKDSRLQQIEGVIHLLGEGVAEKRWSPEQKKKILDSRTISTQNLIASLPKPPKVFISASAIGFYGDSGETSVDENSQPGTGFLPDVCIQWESAVDKVGLLGPTRIVKARIGLVLAPNGGALAEMLPPFQAGVGGALGNGRQWMSWIHIQDIVGLFVQSLENETVSGPVNFVSPHPVRNDEFSKLLASQIHRPKGPNVPGFVLKTLFGEMAAVLLFSQNVSAKKAESLGYQFKFQDLKSALADLLDPQARGEDIFVAKQFIPKKKEEIFPFFADAKNLEAITPELLHFRVLAISTPAIQEGTLIDYKLKVRGVPVKWRTRIEQWVPPVKFVDTALKGPYKLWHHTHTFEDLGSGTLMTDRVRYTLPIGYLGWITAGRIVKKDVQEIFDYRRRRVAEIFNVL